MANAIYGGVKSLQSRVILLVDLDYFFAQAEELRNPTLRGKPVIVGVYSGRTDESGAVSTANYEARKFGVKSGMPLFLARRKLVGVDAVFLPVDHDSYEQISSKLMMIFRGYADVLEQVSIDEAYLDVTLRVHGSFERAKNLAEQMKIDVKRQMGITFSVGIGPNKLVAKVACDSQKPDGLTVVYPDEVEAFLNPLPVERLMGVGKKTCEKMNELGITTVGDLAKFDVQRLMAVFGKTLGVYFHNAANGTDDEPVLEAGEAESISRIATLKQDSTDLQFILEKTDTLAAEVHEELMKKGFSYKQIGIIMILTDLTTKSRMQTIEQPTKSLETLKKSVQNLLLKYLETTDKPIRRIGVKVSQLTKEENSQKRLEAFFTT